jgi:hypothetical protein
MAVMVAICVPLLGMTVGLGIQASGWTIIQQGTPQCIADMAALAGTLADTSGTSIEMAATQAAYVAGINGASSATSPTALSCNPGTTRSWCAAT